MKVIRWIMLSVVALGAAGWMLARAEVGKRNDTVSDVGDLRQQIRQLQARLTRLEERLAEVESAKPGVGPKVEILPKSPGSPPTYLVPSLPGLLGKSQSQPKVWGVWGQREVNGWTAYFIPCDHR